MPRKSKQDLEAITRIHWCLRWTKEHNRIPKWTNKLKVQWTFVISKEDNCRCWLNESNLSIEFEADWKHQMFTPRNWWIETSKRVDSTSQGGALGYLKGNHVKEIGTHWGTRAAQWRTINSAHWLDGCSQSAHRQDLAIYPSIK